MDPILCDVKLIVLRYKPILIAVIYIRDPFLTEMVQSNENCSIFFNRCFQGHLLSSSVGR